MKALKTDWKQIGNTGVKIVIAGVGQCLRVTAIALYVSAAGCQHLGVLAHEKARENSQ